MGNGESVEQHVVNGIRIAAGWLLGMAWLSVVFGGLIIGFSPSKYPRALGWLCLIVAAGVLVMTARYWVKAFPGIMAVGTFNSFITISSGHVTGHPEVLVPKSTAIVATLLMAAGTAVSRTFRANELSIVDRIALLALATSIGWGAVDAAHGLPALAIGIGCLFSAWIYDRDRRSKRTQEVRHRQKSGGRPGNDLDSEQTGMGGEGRND